MLSKLVNRFLAFSDRLTMQSGSAVCYQLMVRQDKRVMFASFGVAVPTREADADGKLLLDEEGKPATELDAMAMVFARGERAADLDALNKQLMADVRAGLTVEGLGEFDYDKELDFGGLSDRERRAMQSAAGVVYGVMEKEDTLFAPVMLTGETVEPMTIIYLRDEILVMELEKRLREADMLDEVMA